MGIRYSPLKYTKHIDKLVNVFFTYNKIGKMMKKIS